MIPWPGGLVGFECHVARTARGLAYTLFVSSNDLFGSFEKLDLPAVNLKSKPKLEKFSLLQR